VSTKRAMPTRPLAAAPVYPSHSAAAPVHPGTRPAVRPAAPSFPKAAE
jgi:hypothetical protein